MSQNVGKSCLQAPNMDPKWIPKSMKNRLGPVLGVASVCERRGVQTPRNDPKMIPKPLQIRRPLVGVFRKPWDPPPTPLRWTLVRQNVKKARKIRGFGPTCAKHPCFKGSSGPSRGHFGCPLKSFSMRVATLIKNFIRVVTLIENNQKSIRVATPIQKRNQKLLG